MSETILRQWTMLRRIKRGQRIGTQELKAYLEQEGFKVGHRTVQRDLVELAKVFPGLKNDGHKPAGWYWEIDAEVVDIPGLNPSMALSFKLVESFLKPLRPSAALFSGIREGTRRTRRWGLLPVAGAGPHLADQPAAAAGQGGFRPCRNRLPVSVRRQTL